MDNISEVLGLLGNINTSNTQHPPPENNIPKEIIDQYPYGQFPSRYTKSGQEEIRKTSENRYSYQNPESSSTPHNHNSHGSLDISSILPIIQMMSKKNSSHSNNLLPLLSKLIFKDNKDMQKILELLPQSRKSKEINLTTDFPNTNKIDVSTLSRVK